MFLSLDVNECSHAELNACSRSELCINLEGGYNCTCEREHVDGNSSQPQKEFKGRKHGPDFQKSEECSLIYFKGLFASKGVLEHNVLSALYDGVGSGRWHRICLLTVSLLIVLAKPTMYFIPQYQTISHT